MIVRGAVLRKMGLEEPYAQSYPLAVEELHLDPPGPGEMLVRILAAGLCHSDLSVIDGSRPRPMPMVLGHEATGEVVETGPDTAGWAPGDRVVFSFVPMCGHCEPCAVGRPVLCEPGAAANSRGQLLRGTTRWRDVAGQPVLHHLGVSGFAEYAVISTRSAVRIERDIAPEIAALFGCAVLTGVGAVVNTARVAPGESVAIFGLGGVGLAAVLGANAASAYPLIAIDPVPAKLEIARALGATHCLLAGADVVAAVRETTRGGVHHAIESVGSETVLREAYDATRRGGTTITVGLPAPDKQFSIPAVSLVGEERTVRGSYMGSAVPARDLPRYMAMYRAGRLPVDRLLTDRLASLEELNAGFDRLRAGAVVRQVLVMPE